MHDLWQTIVLGIIEGVTEFLPISSTGHLLIAEHWLGQRSELFNVTIQVGAILAVLLLYSRRVLDLFLHLNDPVRRDYLLKLTTAFLLTAAGGFLATKMGFKLGEAIIPIASAMLVGGIAILIIERWIATRPRSDVVTWNVAIWVGFCQVLAGVFPGTSRSAATIFAAMLAGLTFRPAATEFAFLVGIPTMFAASGYELLKAHKEAQLQGPAAPEDWTALIIAFIVAGVVAFISVKWLLRYIQSHQFTVFAWYRILFGLTLFGLVAANKI